MKTKAVKKAPVIPFKYVEAVARGVQFLDLVFGRKGWLRRMNMKNFSIHDGSVCVAGNVFESVWNHGGDSTDHGYAKFVSLMEELNAKDNENAAKRFGFITDSEKGMQHLQDLWVMTINKLKAGKNVPGIARAI